MVELFTVADVAAASGDDCMVVWAAQGLRGGVRAWALDGAVAVASPRLNRRDRLTVCGPAAQAAELVRRVLPGLGPSYRLLGERSLVAELVGRLPGARPPTGFEWMETGEAVAAGGVRGDGAVAAGAGPAGEVRPGGGGAVWLPPEADGQVAALLAVASPSAWAVPGVAGIRRWAGIRGVGGELVAVAADAWSAPQVGFVAGVGTAPPWRGRGLGEAVCRFVVGELAAEHGRVALMVDTGNRGAIRVYARLGLRIRPVAAAELSAVGAR
ncbi:GNAT family N-acetyltransferase [Planomonospora sp. ID82291]|uniref:GNAT family N-acetyltransferase n=1 Tax=Planomonospora sp. ID82291 TaxID=2738136 RepID=UPI0018C38873|nr:GNAT family N-acetyltransferase [Planomonospora sp. ID82291]MBG0816568.1 GNAT family N-acetyltransferase [Planomonospora sp. ID82291]